MNKKEILEKVIIYISKSFNTNREEIINNSKYYIKEILRKVRNSNIKVKELRYKRKEIRDDIHDLEVSMVGSQSFNEVQPGRNTGLVPNTVEIKTLKRLTLKEELGKLLIQTELLEKSLEDNNKLIQDFINLLPSQKQATIMVMTYVNCMTNSEIASTMYYSIEAVDICRWRGLKELEKILKSA